MQNIESLRQEIDQIHSELSLLFKKRLKLTQKIWEIKKQENLPFIDLKREEEIIHQFDKATPDLAEQNALQNFYKCLLTESKKYLEAKLK